MRLHELPDGFAANPQRIARKSRGDQAHRPSPGAAHPLSYVSWDERYVLSHDLWMEVMEGLGVDSRQCAVVSNATELDSNLHINGSSPLTEPLCRDGRKVHSTGRDRRSLVTASLRALMVDGRHF